MRYPLSLNPSATIYGLAFLEAGNAWNEIDNFEPFNVRRSAGLGVRIFLPMFGLLGFDYGYGFDLEDVPGFGPRYRNFPLSDCILGSGSEMEIDTVFRNYKQTAKDLVSRFDPETLPEQIVEKGFGAKMQVFRPKRWIFFVLRLFEELE